MRIIPAVLIVILTFANVSCAKVAGLFVDSAKSDGWYIKASLYEQDGDYEEAAELLEIVLETVSDEYIYLKLAGIYEELKDREMTVFTLKRGIKEFPRSYPLLGKLAAVYTQSTATVQDALKLYRKAYEISGDAKYAESEARTHASLKDFNSAIKIYDELIKKNELSDYYLDRGRYYERLGLKQESVEDYSKAVEMDGNFMAAARLADYYIAENDNRNAIKYLKVVLEKSPSLTIAKFRLAELLINIGKTDEAEQYYTEILGFLNEKERLYVLKQLAGIAFENKDFDKAEDYFAKAYEIDQDIKVAYSLAVLAENSGDEELAEKWYRIVLEKRPDFVEASKRLAIIKLRNGSYDEALKILSAVEGIYQDMDFYRIKGQIYVRKGDLDAAADILKNAVEENPNEQKLYLDLALIYDKQERDAEAMQLVKGALKLFPEDPSFMNFLGYMYAEQGIKLDEAEKLISAALDKKPEEPAFLDSLAWVYYQKGLYKKALPLQKKALKGAPEEEEIREHMKAILEKLGINKTIDDILKED